MTSCSGKLFQHLFSTTKTKGESTPLRSHIRRLPAGKETWVIVPRQRSSRGPPEINGTPRNLSNISLANYPFNLERKNQFSVAILNFFDQSGSRIFEPIFFTNLYYRSWKFAIRILKINQLVLKLWAKTRFSAAILNFYDQTGSRILKSRLQGPIPVQTWSYAV